MAERQHIFRAWRRLEDSVRPNDRRSARRSRRGRFLLVGALCLSMESLILGCEPTPREEAAYQGPALRSTNVEGVTVDVMVEGDGPQLAAGDVARVHYRARSFDGRLLDESRKGRPLLVLLDSDDTVIPGLHLALRGMKAGELRRVTIPARLAYRGKNMGSVPTDREMIFELELIGFKPAG